MALRMKPTIQQSPLKIRRGHIFILKFSFSKVVSFVFTSLFIEFIKLVFNLCKPLRIDEITRNHQEEWTVASKQLTVMKFTLPLENRIEETLIFQTEKYASLGQQLERN